MDIQNVITYILVAGAVAFLIKKFFFRKKKSASHCGSDDCGCH